MHHFTLVPSVFVPLDQSLSRQASMRSKGRRLEVRDWHHFWQKRYRFHKPFSSYRWVSSEYWVSVVSNILAVPSNNPRSLYKSRNRLKARGTHTTNPRPGQYLTHAHIHITRVAAMGSCFALIGAHQHGIAVGPLYGKSRLQRLFSAEASAKHSFKGASSTQH